MNNKEAVIRKGTGDDRVWKSVYTKNEYHLADNLAGKKIVDNGFEVHFAAHPTKPEMLGWFYCKRIDFHNYCVEGIENTWCKQ